MVMSENKWLHYIFKLIPFIVVFTVGVCVGYKLMPEKVVVKTEVKTETKVVEVAGETKTEVRYLQKASNSDADVNIKTNNPTVSVNGKKYEFEKLPEEKHKFENGKLEVEQGYTFKIDASALVPKQPKFGLDLGYSNHGLVVGGRYNFNKNVSIGVYGVPKPREGRDKFIGGGLTISF